MSDPHYAPYPGVYFGTIDQALQEWAAVCEALGDGRLMLTARKGGIHEQGGEFRPEQERFLLLPTHLHQESDRLRNSLRLDVVRTATAPRPGQITVHLWAEVAKVWRVEDLMILQSVEPELAWTNSELETRFRYRDQPWLHVLALRVFRFPVPVLIPDDPAYGGCRSWIHLKQPIPTTGSVPVLSTGTFEIRLDRIDRTLRPPVRGTGRFPIPEAF